jgi:hypothetical protein
VWGCTAVNWLKRLSILGTTAIASLAIAQSASARFVIFVSGNDAATLQRVRAVSPTAFTTKINDQPVIQAGTFNSETSADSLAIALQQSGLSAQKYFRSIGGKESNVQVPFPETTTTNSTSSTFIPSNPQSVVIQPTATQQTVTVNDSQPQVFSSTFSSLPQQSFTTSQCAQAMPVTLQTSCAAQPQFQQITTNTVVPQVQTQQVLVPRWQQVLVPETRQVVTQTVVPQTQIVQTGFIQQTGYVQPQTGFIQSTQAPVTLADNSFGSTNFASAPVQTTNSSEPLLPQATQNPNFRYVTAVPANANNQFLLSRVRQFVPNAFFANSGRGNYIHAGAYQNRDSAESVSRYLRSQGMDSRVLYF